MARPSPAQAKQAMQDALALHRAGRLDEAERLYARVLKAQRDHFDALHLLGVLNHQRGKTGEAFRLLTAALRAQPQSADALANLAMVLHALKRDDEALRSVDKALALAPDHLEAHNNRGNLLLALKRPADALASFKAVLARAPGHGQARINKANALAEMGRAEDALVEYDAVLRAAPGQPNALYNRGNALRQLGREADAIASYDGALRAMPAHARAAFNRALALQALNRHDEALAGLAAMLRLNPDHGDAHYARAASLLTRGDYRAGFHAYEWRWKREGMGARRGLRAPLWLGETPLAHRAILLHAEQGLGDTIQFARYAPILARAGARVVIEAQPELVRILSGLDAVSRVIARGAPLPAFDLHCPLASLPLALKTERATVPADIPYLHASPEAVAAWRLRLDALVPRDAARRLRVALAWSGQAAHVNDRNRSIALARLAPLLDTPNVRFVGIQRDLRDGDRAALAASGLVNLGPELTDFTDTASVMAACDLTIAVDSAVIHLAGALGHEAWAMIPFQPDWRWGLGADRSPWYPRIRLFRQPRIGDWEAIFGAMREELASRAIAAT